MSSSTSTHAGPERLPTALQTRLTLSLVAGALLFLITLQTLYLLAYQVCAGAPRWPMHVVAALTAATSLACAAWAWSKRAGHAPSEDGSQPSDTPVNWLAHASALANVWFALVIVSTEVIIVALHACW